MTTGNDPMPDAAADDAEFTSMKSDALLLFMFFMHFEHSIHNKKHLVFALMSMPGHLVPFQPYNHNQLTIQVADDLRGKGVSESTEALIDIDYFGHVHLVHPEYLQPLRFFNFGMQCSTPGRST